MFKKVHISLLTRRGSRVLVVIYHVLLVWCIFPYIQAQLPELMKPANLNRLVGIVCAATILLIFVITAMGMLYSAYKTFYELTKKNTLYCAGWTAGMCVSLILMSIPVTVQGGIFFSVFAVCVLNGVFE